jgi:hypothetical protein
MPRACIRQHTSAYVSIRVRTRHHTSACDDSRSAACLVPCTQRLKSHYLYFCTSTASKLSTSAWHTAPQVSVLYFCTSKASKLRTRHSAFNRAASRCAMKRISLPCLAASSLSSQHTSAYVSICQHTSKYVSIRQHTSAYVSIRQHTSAYVSMPASSLSRLLIHRCGALPRLNTMRRKASRTTRFT